MSLTKGRGKVLRVLSLLLTVVGFKGNTEETCERWDETHTGFPEHVNIILDRTELNVFFVRGSVSGL